jgi:iron complex transport system ATP-binding protein
VRGPFPSSSARLCGRWVRRCYDAGMATTVDAGSGQVATSAAALEARELTLSYGRRAAVDAVSLVIGAGECVALAGPNGSGKSTLLRGLARLMRPATGAVLLEGRRLAQWPPRALARKLAVLPQSPQSPGDLTVEQLVALGRHPHQAFLGLPTAADRAAVAEALAWTDLSDFATRPIRALSGGERQRAWIALTLAQEPEVLLLDEPTTFLDLGHGLAVLDLVRRLNRERGLTVVMALHDLSQAARFADRVVLVRGGRIVCDGPPAEALTPARIAEVFGVEAEVVTTAGGLPVVVPVRMRPEGVQGSPA